MTTDGATTVAQPRSATVFIPNTSGRMVAMDSAELRMSKGPGSGSRDSGITRGPIRSRAVVTGTPTRKTEPHQKCSSRRPPAIGPTTAPTENMVAQTATANCRRRSSMKMLRISERVDGISVAPATPNKARAPIRASGVGAKAAANEATLNAAAP